MTREEERLIILQVLAGDASRFEVLVRAYEKGVYNLALRMLKNEQDALDASQEAFFRAWRALEDFRGDSKFSVWLYRMTSNICLDMLRRASRRPEASLTDEEGGEADLPDPAADPHRALERREVRRAIREGLDRLEPEFRQVLLLREMDGLTYDEIGQVTGLEPGTVKSRIFRARRKLAAILTERGNFFAPEPSNEEEKEGGGVRAKL